MDKRHILFHFSKYVNLLKIDLNKHKNLSEIFFFVEIEGERETETDRPKDGQTDRQTYTK
jgi:hypothetical protein